VIRPHASVASERADLSVVVIAYNEAQNAAACVRSVLDQKTKALFELIFVDDGSSDATAEAAIAAAAGDPRFRLVELLENSGRGAARLAGLKAAIGTAIAFVDADITLPKDWLERCLLELPGHAAVGGTPVPDGDAAVLARVSRARPRVVAGSMPIAGSNVLFNADVLAQTGFDPEDRLGEDFRLANRLQRKGYKLRRIPGLTVEHAESKSYTRALRWRFESGVDASTHAREFRRVRFADLVWVGWLAAWMVSTAGAIAASPSWLVLGAAATAGAGFTHAATRFKVRPLWPFLIACAADVPLLAAYLVGRTVGIPRLIRGRG
jgi:glycosyltransferase involved in cell wall biosynthesis